MGEPECEVIDDLGFLKSVERVVVPSRRDDACVVMGRMRAMGGMSGIEAIFPILPITPIFLNLHG